MTPGRRSICPILLAAVLLLAVPLAATAATGTDADGPVAHLASAGQIRSIPGPIEGLIGGGSADEPAPDGGSDGEENQTSSGDEPLGQHGAQPASDDGLDLARVIEIAAWVVPAGTVVLAGVAMIRLYPPGRSPGRPDEAPPPPPQDVAPPEEPEPEPFLVEQPPPGVDGVLTVAQAFIARDDYASAARWFEMAIALRPKLTVAHFCLGLCLEQMERHEQALDAFEAADELGGTGSAPAYRQARILIRLERPRDALGRLSKALAEEPELREDAAEDPVFDGLRDHPRFLAMLGQL